MFFWFIGPIVLVKRLAEVARSSISEERFV
jgi:hypothetical protein